MRNYILLTFGASVAIVLSSFSNCGGSDTTNLGCKEIQLNKIFTAKVGETWCLPDEALEIKFGKVLEDSRCNVPQIECFWAGRLVEAASLSAGGSTVQDTFRAENGWRDTLYIGNYSIIMDRVNPEIRQSTETLPDEKYSFDMIVK